MSDPSDDLLGRLLKDVSRSFYLTLRLLPGSIRSQIGLAYLLARTSDTIADTEVIPLPIRLKALESLRNNVLGHNGSPVDFKDICTKQASIAECTLLERANQSIDLLNSMDPADRSRIREVLSTILSGQELDLRRFAGANTQNIVSLNDESELDDYTYRVAGCVGEFWTRMLQAHILGPEFQKADFVENGIRFGKGLQLVNILRDIPADLRQGRCYIPATELSPLNLNPAELLKPESDSKFRPIYDRYLDQAQAHLTAGWKYTRAFDCE